MYNINLPYSPIEWPKISTFLLLLLLPIMSSASTNYSMPSTIDANKNYLFFLHGAITENRGAMARHPRYGNYNFHQMLKAISDRGFRVISEIREKRTDKIDYAIKIVDQIQKLIERGTAPEKISIVGFSKGGTIALYTASILRNPKVSFVILAGCGAKRDYKRSYMKFLNTSAADLYGRLLSIYDKHDKIAGSCIDAFTRSANKTESSEIVLDTGKGNGLFYQPDDEWLIPISKWINRDL